MHQNLKEQFHQEMLQLYRKAGEEIGYWAHRFLQKVKRVGGLQAAKDWLRPRTGVSPGLDRLARAGRIELSVEALVLKDPWKCLFTEDELKIAHERLAAIYPL